MPPEIPSPLSEQMSQGPVIGPINLIPNTLIVEQLAAAGFDFVWMDMEHGPQTIHDISAATSICLGSGVCPIVRVPCVEDWAVKWVLDQGVRGIVFPFVNSPQEAQFAISACRYPPAGHRGYFPDVAATRWGADADTYVTRANEELCIILQIEHDDAVQCVEQIAELDGWDLLFVGPMDLSASYGKLGQLDEPEVCAAIERSLAAAHAAGRHAGILAVDPTDIRKRVDQGFDFVAVLPDIGIIGRAVREYSSDIREALK